MTFTHLILSAAGFRAFTFLGAIQAIRDANLHRSVRHVAGCSGGAIAAFAFCIDAEPRLIAARCAASVRDRTHGLHVVGPVRLSTLREVWNAQGVAHPDHIERVLRDVMEDALTHRRMTLRDFAKATGRELALWVTNLTQGRGQALTLETHPELDVVTAILASLAIPLIYRPVVIDDDLMVDGAVTEFLPTSAFPTAHTEQVLLVTLPPRVETPGPGMLNLMVAVFNASMRHRAMGEGIMSIDLPDVPLDASDITWVRFDMNAEKVWEQFNLGHAAAAAWLTKHVS